MQYDQVYSNDKIEQLLKTNDNQNINGILEDLQTFIFSSEHLDKYAKQSQDDSCNKSIPIKSPIVSKRKEKFEPRQKDTLFWCFYVLHMGFDKYEMIGNKHFVEEKELKFKLIELIRSKKEVLKMHKIRPLSELEDDLANKQQITLKTFIALCILTNISVFVVDKHKYYESINITADQANCIHIIHKSIGEPVKFSIDLLSTAEKINNYRENYYHVQTLDNKLKSLASYKYDELLEICKKLGIDLDNSNTSTKKKTKSELYELIILNF